MRDIFIQTKTSINHKRKNLTIVETVDENGVMARAEKKFCYYVSERDPSLNVLVTEGTPLWEKKKKKHVSIRRIFDHKNGTGQMIYRVSGSFYIKQEKHVFAVAYMHCVKFNMIPTKPTNLLTPQ